MINFIICDDNQHMLNKISYLFEKAFVKCDFNAKILLKTTNYKDVLNYISKEKIDVVILDIQFNDSEITGLDIAQKIREINKKCYIIFTTSHFEYIIQAYKFKTFDYLFKNTLSLDIIIDTLNRLFDDIYGNSENYIRVDSKGTILNSDTVLFIEKDGMQLVYHTFLGNYKTYTSFLKIENKLPANFIRCHKSYIVNINNILSINIYDNEILLKDKSICYIGPKYKDHFMEVLNYNGNFK